MKQIRQLFANKSFIRVLVVCFFLGLNLQLVPYFLHTQGAALKNIPFLNEYQDKQAQNSEGDEGEGKSQKKEPSLEPKIILEKLNEQRVLREKEPFEYNDKLASVAAQLLEHVQKNEYELDDNPLTKELQVALKEVEYNYEHVSHNTVVGPLLEEGVIDAWFSSEDQMKALFDDDFTEVGFATAIITTKYNETVGVTVQVLGLEFPKRSAATTVKTTVASNAPVTPAFPEISNAEVFGALNAYRQTHRVHDLQIDQNLCTYAEKRVQDLLAFGSLDAHAGFKKDFADKDNLPQAIQNYSGTRIAENLAYQHCKNMTTGESFVAETGTAIIEWCFDSSTAGHKEAQLSKDFNHVCVAQGKGMFVIIFGGG